MGFVARQSILRELRCVAAAILVAGGLAAAGPARADAGFYNWVQSLRAQARAQGVSTDTFDRAFFGIQPDPEILELASRQAEFIKPIWEYLDGAVSDTRIERGREMAIEWRPWLDLIEQRYGVDRHIVLAVWGMESSYGAVLQNPRIVRSVVRSLGTLAYQGGSRKKFGNTQLMAALQILERGDITPEQMTGSWAGAMGHTQFIPTTYNAYAVDIDGDGRRNIWSSVPDALASTAHYLARSGWNTGETWGYEVVLPATFDFALADGKTRRPVAEWQRMGIARTAGRGFPRPNDPAQLFLPSGANGPAFLLLKNFRVIKRYNNADAYALGIGHLADRIRGGEPFAAPWPRHDPPIRSLEEVREMQARLSRNGYDTGGVDGRIGPMTQRAIRSFQARTGMVPDGYASAEMLARLRAR